jgi:hypothetical protein
MSEAKEYMIAMFDVLGFKSLFPVPGLDEMYRRYETLTAFVREPKSGYDIDPIGGFVAVGHLEVQCAYFSDTFLYWTPYSFPALRSFCTTCSEALCRGIEIGLPLRGAIAVGQAIMDHPKATYLGQPIIEAAKVEGAQNWIGVAFGPSFYDPADKNQFFLDTILPYRSHRKPKCDDLINGCVLDWPRHWRHTRSGVAATAVQSLNTQPEFSIYYDTTLRFIEFSEQHHDWFTQDKHLAYG